MGPLAGGLGGEPGGLGLPGFCEDSMFEGPVQDLIDELGRLPGVGPKSAQRIAFHLLAADPADVVAAAGRAAEGQAGGAVLRGLRQRRGRAALPLLLRRAARPDDVCVVEEPKDVLAVERTREFKGRYHVLGRCARPAGRRRARLVAYP